MFRPKFVENFLVRMFLKYIEEDETIGTNLFIVAKKVIAYDTIMVWIAILI